MKDPNEEKKDQNPATPDETAALKARIEKLEGENKKLETEARNAKSAEATAVQKVHTLEDETAALKASLEAADLTHARQVAALQKEIEDRETVADIAATFGPDGPDLRQVNKSGTTFRYDSVTHGAPGDDWEFVERHLFIEDSGYSDGLRDRALATITRAFETVRLGDVLRGVGQSYNRLPPFKRGHALEVTVRLIPQES